MKLPALILLCAMLSACAEIAAENSSPEPIPAAARSPFDGPGTSGGGFNY